MEGKPVLKTYIQPDSELLSTLSREQQWHRSLLSYKIKKTVEADKVWTQERAAMSQRLEKGDKALLPKWMSAADGQKTAFQ